MAKKATNKQSTSAPTTKNTGKADSTAKPTAEERKAARKAEREKAAAERKAKNDKRKAEKAKREEEQAAKREARKANTRTAVFQRIINEKHGNGKPVLRTKKELQAEMLKQYGGSENEANFQVDVFVRLLLQLGHMTEDTDKKLHYHPHKD